LPGAHKFQYPPSHITKNKFNTKDREAAKSARAVGIAAFATSVNPALGILIPKIKTNIFWTPTPAVKVVI